MAIVTKAAVSWGMYGGATAGARANLFSSWGLMGSLPAAPTIGDFFRSLSMKLHLYLRF